MYFFYKKTKYILKVRSLKIIVIWIFKMAAPDSKMADMQNKVVVFLVQRYIFYNREAKYIFKRCTKEYDVIWTFKMAAANSKMADMKYKCCRFCHRTMHFLNRETICILKAGIMKTRGHDFSKWLPPIPRWPTRYA